MKLQLKPNDFTELPQDWIDSLPAWGPCDNAISDIMRFNKVECDRKAAIRYLANIGYNEPEELEQESDETLISRVLWIALLDCRENDTNEWYMGD